MATKATITSVSNASPAIAQPAATLERWVVDSRRDTVLVFAAPGVRCEELGNLVETAGWLPLLTATEAKTSIHKMRRAIHCVLGASKLGSETTS